MTKMKSVNRAPKRSPPLVDNQRLPGLKRPVIDRVEHLIESQRADQGRETREKPRKRGKKDLQHDEHGRENQCENRHRIPGEKRRFPLLRLDNGKLIFNEQNSAAVVRLLS